MKNYYQILLLFALIVINTSWISLNKNTNPSIKDYNSQAKSTLVVCGDMFTDSGGANGNYSNNENITTTICPDNTGDIVTVSFLLFNVETNFDKLKIYDGDTTTHLIGEYTGTNSPGTISATQANGGCLTFVFTSDFNENREGWLASVSCETPPLCETPSNILVDNITENTATISFNDTNQPSASTWEVEYGNTGFIQGNGTVFTTNSTSFTISGLNGGVTYDIYIRALCGNGEYSYWSSLTTFTTVLYVPLCGEVFYDSGGVNDNYSNYENNTITICPEVSGEIVIASFSSFELENNYDFLTIYDGDTTTNLIGEYTGINSPETVYATLANGGCLTFVFTSDYTINRAGWEAYITCQTPPSCFPPSDVIVDAVSFDSVNLFINDANQPQAPSWEIEYGESGFIQGTGTIYTTTSDYFTINGLIAGTTYDVYVRSNCGNGDYSIWSVPISFTTPSLPLSCGDVFYDTGGINSNYDNFENITTTICPINSGEVVTVTFNSFETENNYDKLKIYDGNSVNNLIGEYTGNNSPGTVSGTLTNGGCLTFVFTSDQSVTRSGWEATINCGAPPSCYTPSEFIVDSVANNSVSLFISEVNSPPASTWEIEYGPTGFTQGTGTIYTTTTDYFTINGLSSGTTYDAYVRAVCSENDSSFWSSSVTFTTSGVATITDFTTSNFNIFPIPTTNKITVQLHDLQSIFNISITDVQGKKIFSKQGLRQETTLDISKLSKGLYFVNIQTENRRFTKKIIKN